jgi:hypothetical protein
MFVCRYLATLFFVFCFFLKKGDRDHDGNGNGNEDVVMVKNCECFHILMVYNVFKLFDIFLKARKGLGNGSFELGPLVRGGGGES